MHAHAQVPTGQVVPDPRSQRLCGPITCGNQATYVPLLKGSGLSPCGHDGHNESILMISSLSSSSSCAGVSRGAGTSTLKLARSSSQLKLKRRKQLPGRLQFGNATVPPSLNWADLGAVSSVKDQGTSVTFTLSLFSLGLLLWTAHGVVCTCMSALCSGSSLHHMP